jgi:hypothetical protein
MTTLIETQAADPAALALVERYQKMSSAELLEDILRHEKEHRGIDWLGLYTQGTSGQAEARQLAQQYIRRLHDDLDSAEIPDVTKIYLAASESNDGVQPMPECAIDLEEANK